VVGTPDIEFGTGDRPAGRIKDPADDVCRFVVVAMGNIVAVGFERGAAR
jgi:hypothetical protein